MNYTPHRLLSVVMDAVRYLWNVIGYYRVLSIAVDYYLLLPIRAISID